MTREQLPKTGRNFHFSEIIINFAAIAPNEMDTTDRSTDGLRFIDTLNDGDALRRPGHVLHVLCTAGSMSFTFQDVKYNVVPHDYVILPNPMLLGGLVAADGFRALAMSLDEAYVATLALRSNYGVIGHLSLLQNPVIRLSDSDFHRCSEDLLRLKERLADTHHLFREEVASHLLTAHILDLYDIHARGRSVAHVAERARQLLGRFVGLLYDGAYVSHRDLAYYASRLCITPDHLSYVCRKVSGKPASYWIDRFTLHAIVGELYQKDASLADIAERFHFSSLSYFSRYVQRHLGQSPSAWRNRPVRG